MQGTCRADGKWLGPGSFSFVPEGVEHGSEETGPQGCTMLHLYLRRG